MPSILERIMDDQSNKDDQTVKNSVTGIPIHNELETILDSLKQSQSEVKKNKNEKIEDTVKPKTKEEVQSFNPNTYEHILSEIQQHEVGMEEAIKNADELSKEVKDSLIYYLHIRKPNRNGILMEGVSDALAASARLIDISVNGRYRLANMKKMRASIIKDMTANTNSSNEFDLASLLSE